MSKKGKALAHMQRQVNVSVSFDNPGSMGFTINTNSENDKDFMFPGEVGATSSDLRRSFAAFESLTAFWFICPSRSSSSMRSCSSYGTSEAAAILANSNLG